MSGSVQSKTTLCGYFQTGCVPTQAQFEDTIVSLHSNGDSVCYTDVIATNLVCVGSAVCGGNVIVTNVCGSTSVCGGNVIGNCVYGGTVCSNGYILSGMTICSNGNVDAMSCMYAGTQMVSSLVCGSTYVCGGNIVGNCVSGSSFLAGGMYAGISCSAALCGGTLVFCNGLLVSAS